MANVQRYDELVSKIRMLKTMRILLIIMNKLVIFVARFPRGYSDTVVKIYEYLSPVCEVNLLCTVSVLTLK